MSQITGHISLKQGIVLRKLYYKFITFPLSHFPTLDICIFNFSKILTKEIILYIYYI